MGVGRTTAVRRLVRTALLLLVAVQATMACGVEAAPPDLGSREAFARSVMAAATSGSVEQVERLATDDRLNIRPEAQQLVESTRGWAPGSWQLRLSNDFPEVAQVEASRNGQPFAVRYQISWSHGRWGLVIGEPKDPPTGGAGLGTGSGSNPKLPPTSGSTEPVPAPSTGQHPAGCPAGAGDDSGAAGQPLECRHFTSTAGNAAGRNLYWLTSTPLSVGFERMDASLTMVVRMPCGALNIPVVLDAFSLTPDPGGLVESADGCAGPAAEHRSWTTGYVKEPMVYQLDAQGLVLTNRMGQIRFTRD
jgi:hypothetical protein